MRGEAIASRSFVSSLHHFVWLSLPSFFLSSILAGGSGRKERSERRTGRQARGMSDAKRRLGSLYSRHAPRSHHFRPLPAAPRVGHSPPFRSRYAFARSVPSLPAARRV